MSRGTGTKTGNKWDARQVKAIELLATGTHTLTDVSKMCPVNKDTLWKWRKNPQFRDAIIVRARELLRDELPDVYKALVKKAKGGNVQHIKVLLEHLERLESNGGGAMEGQISFAWKSKWDQTEDE